MKFNAEMIGHFTFKEIDDKGNVKVLIDKQNAIHPQNVQRIVQRQLSNEHNFQITTICFGDGGTLIDSNNNIVFKSPNDGQLPDSQGWRSKLYNETYRKKIDQSELSSEENGIISLIKIRTSLDKNEPYHESNGDEEFTFNEVALYSSGKPDVSTSGYQDVDVGYVTENDETGLNLDTEYQFYITIDGGQRDVITFTTQPVGTGTQGSHTYRDLIQDINSKLKLGQTQEVTNNALSINTNGFLRFKSGTTGDQSTILVEEYEESQSPLFQQLTGFIQGTGINPQVDGQQSGIQNDPIEYENERERLLTHIIFDPIVKSQSRTYNIEYDLFVKFKRTVK